MNRVDALEFLTGLHIAESGSEIFPLIQSSTFDWIPVIEIAGMKYVAPMIYIKLRNLGLLDDCPADVVDYLTIIYELNCDRNENAVRQTSEIILLLNNNGYIPLLLKGAAHLKTGLYGDPGTRIIGDIDVVIPEDQAGDVQNLLIQHGYVPHDKASEHHFPQLMHPDKLFTVEVHHRILPDKYWPAGENFLAYENATFIQEYEGKYKVLSPTYCLLHNFSHTRLHNKYELYRQVDLRQGYDFYLVMKKYHDVVNWDVIDSFVVRQKSGRMFYKYCNLMNYLFRAKTVRNNRRPDNPWRIILSADLLSYRLPLLKSLVFARAYFYELIEKRILPSQVRKNYPGG